MTAQPTIRHIRTLEEFEELHEQWNNLLTACSNTTVFLTWEWLTAWWKHHRADSELWLITAWQEDVLVGAAPLMKTSARRLGLRFRLLRSLGAPNSDESSFLARGNDPAIHQSLCDYLYSQRAHWDALEVNELKSDNPANQHLQDYFTGRGCQVRIKSNFHYHIPVTQSWEAYWKSLSKNLRHNIERRLRRVEEKHRVHFQVIEGSQLTRENFETIFEVNKKGNYPEKYAAPEERNLQFEFMERMRALNWIRLSILWFDEQPVAFDYGFALDGNLEDWRTGFDLAFADWGTGNLLLYFQLKYMFTEGYRDLDFLRGEYDYKDKWAGDKREFVELRIIPSHRILARLVFIWLPELRQWLKSKSRQRKS